MNSDYMTLYREYEIASDAKQVVSHLWMDPYLTCEAKEVLDSVRMYLYDRLQIALEFYGLALAGRVKP